MKTINPILNTFITGDCEQVLKEIPSDSIDFVLTSPPYADKRDYGNENSSISPDEYVEWFLPKGREIYRVLQLASRRFRLAYMRQKQQAE